MSVTFSANCTCVTVSKREEPCLCAQMCEHFGEAFENGVTEEARKALKEHALLDCPICHGAGVEVVEEDDAPYVNWCNDNAAVILQIMGLPVGQGLCGVMSIAEARRGVIRARNRSTLDHWTRPSRTTFKAPYTDEEGTLRINEPRSISGGLSVDDITVRINQFTDFVESVDALGATTIRWS